MSGHNLKNIAGWRTRTVHLRQQQNKTLEFICIHQYNTFIGCSGWHLVDFERDICTGVSACLNNIASCGHWQKRRQKHRRPSQKQRYTKSRWLRFFRWFLLFLSPMSHLVILFVICQQSAQIGRGTTPSVSIQVIHKVILEMTRTTWENEKEWRTDELTNKHTKYGHRSHHKMFITSYFQVFGWRCAASITCIYFDRVSRIIH